MFSSRLYHFPTSAVRSRLVVRGMGRLAAAAVDKGFGCTVRCTVVVRGTVRFVVTADRLGLGITAVVGRMAALGGCSILRRTFWWFSRSDVDNGLSVRFGSWMVEGRSLGKKHGNGGAGLVIKLISPRC